MADPDWRDSAGKRLVDYPRPSVAVDVAVLTVVPGEDLSPSRRWSEQGTLAVLVHRRPSGEWALPGTFLHEGERLADAVARALHDKLGLDGVTPHQLRVFDDPTRDPRGWVLSVAHAVVIPHGRLTGMLGERDDVTLRPRRTIGDAVADLAFDHQQIVAEAVDELRALYQDHPDPLGLLPQPFTLLQLRMLHETIIGEALQKDTFRRRMEPHLQPTERIAEGTVGRPARLFRRR